MNIDTIKKYKNEFDHFVNGGSVLSINCIDTINWREVDEFHWRCNKIYNYEPMFVINDKYVELRKALAKGKVIEYLGQSSNVWHEVPEPDFKLHPTCYRIKPDEPKFKVGDFVRYIHHSPNTLALQINNINCGRYYFVNSSMSCVEHELEPWKPIKDEWCWFYDSKTNKYSHLSQFNSINNGYFKSMSINYYNFCEPFLNSKPSYLRDK